MVMPYVTDTHAIIWHLTGDPQLSTRAKRIFQRADTNQDYIVIPCIVLLEIVYLIEKRKIAINFESLLKDLDRARNYKIEPLCLPIIEKSRTIQRGIKDPWDRLIAATALHLGMPLISRDRSLRKLGLQIIW
jgi:PIN domain nuclease of toxin-antitoxin system